MNPALPDPVALESIAALMRGACTDLPGLYGMLLSTSDGKACATFFERPARESRLSAMASSILALGETIARESKQKECRYVILDNTDGFVVCLRVNNRFALTCLADNRISLGLLLSTGKATAEQIFNVTGN